MSKQDKSDQDRSINVAFSRNFIYGFRAARTYT